MTSTDVQQLELAISQLTGEVKALNDKVECLLDGKVANCARQEMRITALEKHSASQWACIGAVATALLSAILKTMFC